MYIEERKSMRQLVCEVNNYQYGMSQFASIRKQFAYKEELVNSKLHRVYLQFNDGEINIPWLTKLLNGRVYSL